MKRGSTRDTFPSKIYTIMACGRSALASADSDSELAWILRDTGAGRCVAPEDPPAFREAVGRAFEERRLLPAEGERGRDRVVRDYSKEAVAQKYHALITSLVGEESGR
jgi:glycosyltransferase involved in cell wall biosynthesis